MAPFFRFLLALCVTATLAVHAQDKPQPRTKASKEERAAASASDNPAPRASLARPPTSGAEPMMNLGPKNKPFTDVMHHTTKLDYYDCKGIVADWFRELVTAELNYFAELVELPFVNGKACLVGIGTSKSLTPGRISLHFYPDAQRMNDCVINEVCPTFRSVSLIPKGQVLYRSYFLSDMGRKIIAQHCVTAKGKLHSDTTCYTVP